MADSINQFDDKSLQWNIHTKGIWVNKKKFFLERIHKFKFVESKSGFEVPSRVKLDIEHFYQAQVVADMSPNVVSSLAYDIDHPKDFLYGLKCEYADCQAIIYLHSNARVVSVIAVQKIPRIAIVSPNSQIVN